MEVLQPVSAFRKGCLPQKCTQVEFFISRISLNAYAALARMELIEFDWSKKEIIRKENKIQPPLLSTLIKFISIYFLPDACVPTIIFKFTRSRKSLRNVEFT
jgi:hypothetical protein